MRMDSPSGETAQDAMEWVGGLFRREVVDWRQAEVLEISKGDARDPYCTIILADPDQVDLLEGAEWEGRGLCKRPDGGGGAAGPWKNLARNELRITNLPHDIGAEEGDRQRAFVAALQEVLEDRLGALDRGIVTLY
jgi:hypothetical protein